MGRIKILTIIIVCFEIFASTTIAENLLSEADFLYGITIDNQCKNSISNDTPQNMAMEVNFKKDKTVAAHIIDILNPMGFYYGYTDKQYEGCASEDVEIGLKKNGTVVTPSIDILNPIVFYGYDSSDY